MLDQVRSDAGMDEATRSATGAQIEHEAGIMHHDASKSGRADADPDQERLDAGQEISVHRYRLALLCSPYVLYLAPGAIGNTL
ncbi:hypothetical protein SPHINGO361_120502 [Sphingomonas sp. EC-HK361]|nr:hypothetical protein SPHINGO361_120502 [Sphingomonas sp. EC-HK361]